MLNEHDISFGKMVVSLGIVDTTQLASCVALQKQLAIQGKNVSLKEVIVHRGMIDADQLAMMEKQSFGRYCILQEIGRGGMGRVYKAYDPKLERVVAIKTMVSQNMESLEDIERFRREAKAIASLEHPNIVKILDIGQQGDFYYFAMDFIAGKSLQAISKEQSCTIQEIIQIMYKVAEAIEHSHRRGILHRDLKPANIMIDDNKNPSVMDFGLAKIVDENNHLSKTGEILGTLRYMPPEQALGKITQVDQRSDVYSLGAVLYQLLTGTPAFTANKLSRLLSQVISKQPVAPSSIQSKIPKELDFICLKALEKSPHNRYQSAASFADDLMRCYRGKPIDARSTFAIHSILRNPNFRKLMLVCAVMLFALVLGFSYQSYQQYRTKEQEAFQQQQQQRQKWDELLTKSQETLQEFASLEVCINTSQLLTQNVSFLQTQRYKESLKQHSRLCSTMENDYGHHKENQKSRELLAQMYRNIGFLALNSQNYILGQIYFEKCHQLENTKESQQLTQIVTTLQNTIKTQQKQRIEEIMLALREIPDTGMFDEYVSEIVKMQSSYATEELVKYLQSHEKWQVYAAIETIGKLGYSKVEVAGKDVGQWLMEELRKCNLKDLKKSELIIWALGRLKDARANTIVEIVRNAAGVNSALWDNTEAPYSWLPIATNNSLEQQRLHIIGQMKLNKGDYDGAISDLAQALKTYRHPEVFNDLGLAYDGKQQYEKAIKYFNQAIAMNANYIDAYVNRANAYQQLSKFSEALADNIKVTQLDPNSSEAFHNIGLAKEYLGDNIGAIRAYSQSISIDPQMAMSYNKRGDIRSRMGDYRGAMADMNAALKIHPEYVEAYNNRGLLYNALGKFQEALADYNKAIKINPRYPDVYNNRGALYFMQNKFKLALADYNQAIALDPRLANAYRNRGGIHALYMQRRNAVADYKKYLELTPDDQEDAAVRKYVELYQYR